MRPEVEMRVRNRLQDIDVEGAKGKLPDNLVEFILELTSWAVERERFLDERGHDEA